MTSDSQAQLAGELARDWSRAIIALGVCLLGLLGLLSTTTLEIVGLWRRNPFGHGYLVIPAVFYLIWVRRSELRPLRPKGSPLALLGLASAAACWVFGSITATSLIQQLGLLGMVWASIWAVLGTAISRRLTFPLGLMLFALPLLDRFVPALQDATARVAVSMLSTIGIPALLEGHVISIPGSQWKVAEACSGINYLVTSVLFGYWYAGTFYSSWSYRIPLIIAAIIVPLIPNGFRVFSTIAIGWLGLTQISAGLEHELYGLIVFAAIMYIVIAVAGRRQEPADPDGRDASVDNPSAPTGTRSLLTSSVAMSALALSIVLVTVVMVGTVLTAPSTATLPPPLEPRVAPLWEPFDGRTLQWSPRVERPEARYLQSYRRGHTVVTLFMAYYGADRRDVKLATDRNAFFDAPWWSSKRLRVSGTIEQRRVNVYETSIHSGAESALVWSWYRIDGTSTGSDYAAKIELAKSRVAQRTAGAAVVAIATSLRSEPSAREALQSFADALGFARRPES